MDATGSYAVTSVVLVAPSCDARDPVWGSALVVDAALAPGALNLDVVYDADRPSTIVRVPLPARSAD